MAYPFDDFDPEMMGYAPPPDLLPTQGGMMAPPAMPPVSEPDFLAEMQAPQELAPDDFWARVAMGSGPQPFAPMRLGNKPTGLEVLLALAGGFANAKAGQGARRVDETEQRNARVRAAASELAKRKYELRREAQKAQDAMELAKANAASRVPPKESLKQVIVNGRRVWVRESEAEGKEAPAPDPMVVPVLDPNTGSVTYTTRTDAVGKPTPVGRRRPTTREREELIDDNNLIAQTGDIRRLHRPEFTGPYAGGVRGGVLSRVRSDKLLPGEAEFRSAVATYANKARNKLFGSALTKAERDEALKQLPDVRQPTETMLANIDITENNLRRVAGLRRQTYEATGLDLSGIPDLPGGESAGEVIELVRDPATGRLVRKQ